jgi:hypothetical protein
VALDDNLANITTNKLPDPEPPPLTTQAVINYMAEQLSLQPTSTSLAVLSQQEMEDIRTESHRISENDVDIPRTTETHASNATMTANKPTEAKAKIHRITDTTTHNRISIIRLIRAATAMGTPLHQKLRLHIDGGANRSITNDATQLLQFKNIKPYPMSTAGGDSDLICTGVGYLPWKSTNGYTILIRCYYSKNAVDTIVSPSDIALNHLTPFHTWTKHANLESNQGWITFLNENTKEEAIYPLVPINGLWYYINDDNSDYDMQHTAAFKPIIKWISMAAQYELIHARMGHPGEKVVENIHQHVDGIPKVTKPPLYKCATCTYVNITKRAITQKQLQTITNALHAPPEMTAIPCNKSSPTQTDTMKLPKQRYTTGQAFHMDMGIVHGTKYSRKDDDGNLVTSIDGYNSYLLIVDRATR